MALIALARDSKNKLARRVLEGTPADTRKRTLSRTYADLVEQVSRVIADADPAGLLAAGAPADEYEPEVAALIPRLQHAPNLESLERAVGDMFDAAFGVSSATQGRPSRALAEQLWSIVAPSRSGGG
jgi:hypothetical protein